MREGIEDGFHAPFRVINVKTNIGDGRRPVREQRDINGVLIEDRIRSNSDYDYNIIIQDRVIISASCLVGGGCSTPF